MTPASACRSTTSGPGYSSLSYLQRFPVTTLKIARDFVDVDGLDADAWELVSAIVALGRALRLSVIAEGVEQLVAARPAADPRLRVRPGLLLRAAARPRRRSRRSLAHGSVLIGDPTTETTRATTAEPDRRGESEGVRDECRFPRAPNRTFVPLADAVQRGIVRNRRQPGGLSPYGLKTRQTRRKAGTQSQGSSGTRSR